MATAVASYAVWASGVLPGSVALVGALALGVMVPSDPLLRRRVVLNLSVGLGWMVVPWWEPWPVPVNHAALALALTAGALAWRVVDPGSRLGGSALLPRLDRADAALGVAVLAGLGVMHRWAFASTPGAALEVLLPGFDNAPHFSMFRLMRAHGAMLDSLGRAPDGSSWAFSDYPQGFHAVVATLSEVLHPQPLDGGAALLAYSHGVAAVVVIGIVALTAAVLCLPGLAARPVVLTPSLALVWTAFLWQPGQTLIADGFASFWLGCAAVSVALLLGLAPARRFSVPEFAAVGGLLVLVAWTWTPLMVLAAPAVLALLVPPDGRRAVRRPSLRAWWCLALLVAAGLASTRVVLVLLRTVGVQSVVTAVGGFHPPRPAGVLLVIFASLAAHLLFGVLMKRLDTSPGAAGTVLRARVLALTPVLGLVTLALLLAAQMRAGEGAYYFVKYLTGVELVAATVTAALLAVLTARAPRPRHPRRAAVLGAAAVVGVTQLFGTFPTGSAPMLDSTYPGTTDLGASFSRAAIARGILRAASGAPSPGVDYLAVATGQAKRLDYPDGWFHAVNGSLTVRSAARVDRLHSASRTVPEVGAAAAGLLGEPGVRVVVDPRFLVRVRGQLPAGADRARVVSWDTSRR